jgi:Glycosyl-transferase for dystroglycan
MGLELNFRRLPCNKSELMRLSKAKVARPYHKKAFSLNQRSTNFSRWERMAAVREVAVAYPVDKFIFHYEPVYVAQRGTPPFSERYIGYGMTRNTQAYEMLLANYTFYVLDNAFLSHWGFQLKRIKTSKAKFRQVSPMKNFTREAVFLLGLAEVVEHAGLF